MTTEQRISLAEYRTFSTGTTDNAGIYALMADGEFMCFACVTTEGQMHEGDTGYPDDEQWQFLTAQQYDDDGLVCANCYKPLPRST